jgi:hypothetical protein
MQKCPHCGVEYPPEILSPVVATGGATAEICGICALAMINQAHGIRRRKFDGPVAERLRQAALAWRQKLGVKP